MVEDRRNLTFAQAEGAEPLPSQLQLRTISSELSASLWAIVHISLNQSIKHSRSYNRGAWLDDPWYSMLESWWVISQHKNIDEFPQASMIHGVVKSKMTSLNYIEVFDFLQFIVRQDECPQELEQAIGLTLINCRSPYRLIDKTIIPIATDEESAALSESIACAIRLQAEGPRTHLRSAGMELGNGNWAASIRESIHAVESAAKMLDANATTLGPALTTLRTKVGLNPAMEKAFKALYGFSSDESGIRHALMFEGQANVTERDAMFMLGACASFVTYLLSTSTQPE